LINIHTIEILDIEGRLLFSEKMKHNSPDEFVMKFDLSAYPGAAYFVKIITRESVYIKRVVQH